MDNENKLPEPDLSEMLRNGAITLKTNSEVIKILVENKDSRLNGLMAYISCINCPMNMWQTTRKDLRNYCGKMHVFTWTTENPGDIDNCDGALRIEEEK